MFSSAWLPLMLALLAVGALFITVTVLEVTVLPGDSPVAAMGVTVMRMLCPLSA